MKQILVMMAVVVLVGCGEDTRKASPKKAPENPNYETDEVVVFENRLLVEAIAKELKKPAGRFAPPPKFTEAELEKVTRLDLERCKITDFDLKEITKLQNLVFLNLCWNQITDEGLVELAKMQKLRKVALFFNFQVTIEGAAELQKALPNCSVGR